MHIFHCKIILFLSSRELLWKEVKFYIICMMSNNWEWHKYNNSNNNKMYLYSTLFSGLQMLSDINSVSQHSTKVGKGRYY